MDQISSLANILEYNNKFKDFIIHNCPCYNENYKDFSNICIENKSYLACIVVKKGEVAKILHLKLPIMFGSLIDYTIRGPKIDNYNQFGCLYLEGCVRQIYNFISNNLTPGHVYTNRKENMEVFKVSIDDECFSLHMTYNPQIRDSLKVKIQDVKYEKSKKLENNLNDVQTAINKDKEYELYQPKNKRQKTKLQTYLVKLENEYSNSDKNLLDKSSNITWISLLNTFSTKQSGLHADFKEEEWIDMFNAYLEYAPKLDEISNKINRTISYVLHRALLYSIDNCYINDKELKTLSSKLLNMYKNGNMYFTLTQVLKYDNKLVKGFRSIYQNMEAQKIGFASILSSTIKRSVNDSIKNSKALMYPNDGFQYTCPIDSREMKGAGENVMLGQLVIIPISIDLKKVIQFIENNKEMLKSKDFEEDQILLCVINSFLQPFKIARSKLLEFKKAFPTLSLMLFGKFLVINTNGYNQMKYSVKYECFISTFEYQKIWPDAFDNYHPHLALNSCALYLPETSLIGLPAKLIVANANVRGRCAEITNLVELVLFLHTNGASNAAIIHKIEKSDAKVIVSFDGLKNKNDHIIVIPIKLQNPQLRYLNIGSLGFLDNINDMPDYVKQLHANFNPIPDLTEAYGMSLSDIVIDSKKTQENIQKILYDLYENDTRLEFIDTKRSSLMDTDEPLLVNNNKIKEQIILDNKQYHIKGYVRDNTELLKSYKKALNFTFDKKHPPHMYIYVAFGDYFGSTNEDGIIIDKKLTEQGPKKLISQTLNITYTPCKDIDKKQVPVIRYVKISSIINNEIIFGVIDSTVKMTFNKTKNTTVKETFIPPSTYHYTVSVENTSKYVKYITSTFLPKTNNLNIHFSYVVPISVGTKFSTSHGQKGIICKVMDLSSIVGYTKKGEKVHPLMLLSPTSVLGRTMSNQVMSMATQPNVAFTADGCMISPHGVHVHNIDPSIKTRQSEVKNDLMTTENGFTSNELPYTMKVLSEQKCSEKKEGSKLHFVNQLLRLQGVTLKLLTFKTSFLTQSL
ncbi:LEF-8 [Carcinus maenas nudivirus]|uniref:DNA-directed RNA polymerase n=1 Tax=Carcinus maenas nudivirus TaxID=2880837 RepID=A0AAE8Y0R6_9VIRU|nr:LEF-8 [Carcinus maenas nudivirus]UBZ25606.1 LEF-8 [Carcinus maenas nudivirus]